MKRRYAIKQMWAVALVMLLALAVAVPGALAYSVKSKVFGTSGTAGETLAVGDVVCIKDADGLVYKADANDAALRPAVGIVGMGGASGEPVEIVVLGVMRGWTTLSEGANAYLSETAAAVTQSAPTYAQKIGFALSTTEYLFTFQNSFDTSALAAIGTLTGATPIILEGATADAFETTIVPTDPTAARTVTLPDRSGTVKLETVAVTAKTQADTPFTVTTAYAGQMLTNSGASGAIVFDLPEASTWVGQTLRFSVLAAQNLDVNAAAGDLIVGLTNAAGDSIRNATVGGSVTLMAIDATNIVAVAINGTWADAN